MSKAADQAYLLIRDAILSGELPPGAPVKEEEMASRTGLSRTPVRDAIRRLEAEMFIHRTDSQRSFVNSWSAEDIKEVFTLRGMLEAYAAERAAQLAKPTVIDALIENNAAVSEAISQPEPDVAVFLQKNAEYHKLILEAAASEKLGLMLNRVLLQPIVQRTALAYGRAQLKQSLSEHEETVVAISRRDSEWARAVMTAHVRRAYHTYMGAKNLAPSLDEL